MSNQAVKGQALVMGAAIGYGPEHVRPFLGSLRKSGYRGDIALIVNRADLASFRAHATCVGVILIPADEWMPNRAPVYRWRVLGKLLWFPFQALEWAAVSAAGWLPVSAEKRRRLQSGLARRLYHPQLARFFYYEDFVAQHPYGRILLTDVRDVFFQRDPFEQLPAAGLAVGLETEAYTIGTEFWNSRWIRNSYGSKALSEIGQHPVSCAGVTFGDHAAISNYLRRMCDEILSASLRAVVMQADQGMHNYLLWTGCFGTYTRLPTFGSAVATLNTIEYETLPTNPKGELLNADGSVVSIVHQYDRCPKLAAQLLASLASNWEVAS